MATETNLTKLNINRLTRAQYLEADIQGQISPSEIYVLKDVEYQTTSLIDDTTASDSTVYSSSKTDSRYLKLTGGTLTGDLKIDDGTRDIKLQIGPLNGGSPKLLIYGNRIEFYDTDHTKLLKLKPEWDNTEAGYHKLKNDTHIFAYEDWVESKGYLTSAGLKTINGVSLIGTGDITISGGSGAGINDSNISASTTYSSKKIDETYLKAPEGILNIENGRITLKNNLNSIFSITNNEVVMELSGTGLNYHNKEKNLDVNITPYYGGTDQTVDNATIKVNGIGLARETERNKKVSLTGDTMTGALITPSITIDATTEPTGSSHLVNGALNFKYKNTNDEPYNAWLNITSAGTLEFGSTGGTASEISTVATQKWVENKLSNTYKFKGSVDTYADLPSLADNGDVYNVTSTGMNYAWTGTEWDELGATVNLDNYALKTEVAAKQDTLVSGTNIKTINGASILGEGDITVAAESGAGIDDTTVSTDTTYSSSKITTELGKKQDTLTSGTNIKTINGQDILGSGNIEIQAGTTGTVVKFVKWED